MYVYYIDVSISPSHLGKVINHDIDISPSLANQHSCYLSVRQMKTFKLMSQMKMFK